MAFNIFRNRQPTAMDAVIRLMYGDRPPQKTADLATACKLAYTDLLRETIAFDSVRYCAKDLFDSPMPYSTYDLATSVALNFLKDKSLIPKLFDVQLSARLQVMNWTKEGKVVLPLARSFENVLYNAYKPSDGHPPSPSSRKDYSLEERLEMFREAHRATSPQEAAGSVKKFIVWQHNNAQGTALDLQEETDSDFTKSKIQLIERAFFMGAALTAMTTYDISTDKLGLFFQNILGQTFGFSEPEQVEWELTAMDEAADALPAASNIGATLMTSFLLDGPRDEDKHVLASALKTFGA